jgi:hypothetical protein
MCQGIVIEELHGDSGRNFFGRLEQANQQDRSQEFINESIADAKLYKQ